MTKAWGYIFSFVWMLLLLKACIGEATLPNSRIGRPITGPVQVGKLKMSPLGCGTWSWGNRFLWGYKESDDDSLKQTFNQVLNLGYNWFDTADSYGTGSLTAQSELLLGKFSKEREKQREKSFNKPPSFDIFKGNINNNNNDYYFATKLAPFPWRIGASSMKSAASLSQQRLQRPIDATQLHWPPTFGWQEREYLEA